MEAKMGTLVLVESAFCKHCNFARLRSDGLSHNGSAAFDLEGHRICRCRINE
jgi:hypothetical protein